MVGGGIAGIIILVVVILLGTGTFSFSSRKATQTATPTTVVPATPTVEVPTNTPPPTATIEPSITPTPTFAPPILPYVRITSITIDDQSRYVVEYETYGYTEQLPGMHVHFFFDTVPPDQAGAPGSGPWKLYGGPRPFTEYTVSNRPAEATQMCALVANADHSVQPDSGNCEDLP